MDENKYKEDLQEIKDIMSRSSRFISLSGMSGVFAGIAALIGAYAAYSVVYAKQNYLEGRTAYLSFDNLVLLLAIAGATMLVAVLFGIYFTTKESKKKGQKLWDTQTKRLLINFAIPLGTGGIVALILLLKGDVGIVAPLTLVFYGLALVNASKYTTGEIRSLGILEIILGLIALYFIGYGLIFWAIGFGLLHIIYGILMHLKNRS